MSFIRKHSVGKEEVKTDHPYNLSVEIRLKCSEVDLIPH